MVFGQVILLDYRWSHNPPTYWRSQETHIASKFVSKGSGWQVNTDTLYKNAFTSNSSKIFFQILCKIIIFRDTYFQVEQIHYESMSALWKLDTTLCGLIFMNSANFSEFAGEKKSKYVSKKLIRMNKS